MFQMKRRIRSGGAEAERFLAYLGRRGLPATVARRRVAEAVFASHEHVTGDELYRGLRAAGETVGRVTVYRTLALLAASGMVASHRAGRALSYEHTTGHEHHDHLLCLRCGKSIPFADDGLERLKTSVPRRMGFEPVGHTLTVTGYCRRCRTLTPALSLEGRGRKTR